MTKPWKNDNLLLKFNEYKINNTEYDVKKIRHYTTLKSLISILQSGYLKAGESKGDRWYTLLTDEEKHAVSFLDAEIDSELPNILWQNSKKGTLKNAPTAHLALHMNKIAAMIEIDLGKFNQRELIKPMTTLDSIAKSFPEAWNNDVDGNNFRYIDAKNFIDIIDGYVERGYDRDWADKEIAKVKSNYIGTQIEDYLPKDKNDTYNRSLYKNYAKTVTGFEKFLNRHFKKMTSEDIEKFNDCVERADIRGLYKILYKLGVRKSDFITEDRGIDMYPTVSDTFDRCSPAVNSFLSLLKTTFYAKKRLGVELRVPQDVYLNKDNCTVYIFTGLAEGTKTSQMIPRVMKYADRYNIKLIEPGKDLEGNDYPSGGQAEYDKYY